jgi:hypothetical protein
MSVLAWIALGAAGLAQQDPRGVDFVLSRMKERLNLSEDQVSKVREILSRDVQDRARLEEDRTSKINEVLDEDQKRKYEEFRNALRGPGAGGPGGGFRGVGVGMQPLSLEGLKRDLSLTEEQAASIKPIVEEWSAGLQKRMEDLRGGGLQGLNFGAEIQKFQESLRQVLDRIKEHLTADQKPKADALYDRLTGWTRLIPPPQEGGRGPGQPLRPSPEERLKRALEALRIDREEERNAIRDLIARVLKAEQDLEDFGRESRERLSRTARNRELSDAAVEDSLKEFQEERKKREKELSNLQRQLAEVVNNRQEIELIVQGILK